jgi:hypothetical protein
VSRYDGASWQTFTTKDGLADNSVWAILQDWDGNLWFAIGGEIFGAGVNRYDGASWQTFTTEDGLVNNNVNAILLDGDGNLWFGTSRGVSRYDGTSWQTFTNEYGLVPNAVFILGTVLIPLYFLISLVYTGIRKVERDQYLLLSRKTLLLIPALVVAVVLSLVTDFVFVERFGPVEGMEVVFLTFAICVIPLFFIISLVYTVARKVSKPARESTN